MNLSELCIRRPIMIVLLSCAVIVAGILAYGQLPIAALPSYNSPVIAISASLPGASSETMASSVATPLERQFATISGISVISSTSTLGNTNITLEFDNDRDIDAAAVDVQAALLRAQRSLPIEMTAPPSYRKVNPADAPILFLALSSPALSLSDLNAFAENLILPSLATLPGVAQVQINGQKRFAVRIQIQPDLLAARNLTLDNVAQALKAANANTPIGTLENNRQVLTIQANKQLLNAEQFKPLIIGTSPNGNPIRLQDVADVQNSVESLKTGSWVNGERTINLAILRQPNANTVATVEAVKAAIPRLTAQMPASIELKLLNDRSISIRESIADVKFTLLLTAFLVILVIFLFLRRWMATFIPALSLPISLFGTMALMQALGYSLDNISLLGITLAVGLVVDDAIVMLENIVRHIEHGTKPLQAALIGSREMGFTIISISISLVAVFIPIFFMPGTIGLLFHEFAVVVSLAVLVSAVVSLTLIPMLCSRFLYQESKSNTLSLRFTQWFEDCFQAVLQRYTQSLDWALRHRSIVLMVAISTFVATALLFIIIPKGFFPNEDIGQILVSAEGSQDASYPAMVELLQQAGSIIRKNSAVATTTVVATGDNTGRMFINLVPRKQRPGMDMVLENLRREVRQIPGLNLYFNPIQNLRLGGKQSKSRYQYILQSVSADELQTWADQLMNKMRGAPQFRDVTSDAQMKGLQAQLKIDTDKANALGVNNQEIRTTLYNAFGERQVATIYTPSDSYPVILQASPEDRFDESAFNKLYLRSKNGNLVPLNTLATVERTAGPVAINHQGQLQAVTLSFNLAPGVSLGEASEQIQQFQNSLNLPTSIITSYGGDAAAFQSSQAGQAILLISALLVIYVLLGVLYESYIHPLTILSGLPSAAVGALITLWLFDTDLSLIATIGILMLIGIVKKNAIMMIDFALVAQRQEGRSPSEAIREACLLRFRPIMMTTLAALMGAIPIASGLGAGAELRQPLGLAVVGGLLFSQVITLYITPVIYLYLDRFSGKGPLTLPMQ